MKFTALRLQAVTDEALDLLIYLATDVLPTMTFATTTRSKYKLHRVLKVEYDWMCVDEPHRMRELKNDFSNLTEHALAIGYPRGLLFSDGPSREGAKPEQHRVLCRSACPRASALPKK